MVASEPGRPQRLPRPTLRSASVLAAIGATVIPVSLFLSWFEILGGDKEGNYTGWYSFHRTDRVLAALALVSLGSAFLSPSRRVAAVRGVLGLAAVAVIAREIAVPPVVDPTTVLGPGAYLGLAGGLGVLVSSLSALESVRTRARWLCGAVRRVIGRGVRAIPAAARWLRGEPEPVEGEAASSLQVGRGVLRGVPELSRRALGLFRIAYGLGLIAVFTLHEDLPSRATPAGAQAGSSRFADFDWVRWLASDSTALATVEVVSLVALGCFVLGLVSRLSYLVAVGGVVAAALVRVAVAGNAHDYGLPTVTACLLLIVPWSSAGLSVDALIRRRRGNSPPDGPSRRYGLAVWIPSFTLGVAFLAAAYAKLSIQGLEWITGGAVKYHFVDDARQAPVDWGLYLASIDEVAVLMSLSAVVIEAVFFLVVLSPRPAVRFGFGLVGASLLGGFYLFQGVFWLPWWVLLLSLLPWEGIYRAGLGIAGRATVRASATDAPSLRVPLSGGLRVGALALVIVFLAQQVVVSGARIEQEPLLTNFPMYSGTWSSEEAFNEGSSAFSHYRFERRPANGPPVDLTGRIEAIGGSDPLVDAFEAQDGEELDGDEAKELTSALRALESTYEKRYGESLGRVHTVSERTAGFDFDRAAFDERVLYRTTHVVDPSRFQATAVLYHASVPTVGLLR